ncbi:MAG: hypothetical protein MUD14_13030 [Hydrococcus sp. Prado102]|nr:hypothetical protein [Hydrococcus sp. Prado102]
MNHFIQDLYVHLGFQPAYKYKTVLELIFDGGELIDEADKSEEMERFRQKIPHLSRDSFLNSQELELWKEECLHLGYDGSMYRIIN